MHTALPTQTSKLQNCNGQGHARDKDDVVNDIEEDGVHAHVSIEEDGVHAQVSEQATSDYHRLLREPTDLAAAIVVVHPVRDQKGISGRITLALILGRNSLRFGCFILKCSQVHEMIHQP